MLRKKLHEVNLQSRTIQTLNEPTQSYNDNQELPITIETHKITKIIKDKFYTEDDKEVILYNPLPGVTWECKGQIGAQNIVILEDPLEALVINDGTDRYCIGINGATSEFQITIQVGENKVQVTKDYVNIQAEHVIVNGVEEQ